MGTSEMLGAPNFHKSNSTFNELSLFMTCIWMGSRSSGCGQEAFVVIG